MAKEELNPDLESNADALSIAETKSAVLMSALFVLRKLVFNQKRYRLDEQIKYSEELKKYVIEFKQTLRLFEWSLFNKAILENNALEQYVYKVQLYEILYKIHHTILSIMPHKVENYIEEIDYLLKVFEGELEMVTNFELVFQRCANLVTWFNELIEPDFTTEHE